MVFKQSRDITILIALLWLYILHYIATPAQSTMIPTLVKIPGFMHTSYINCYIPSLHKIPYNRDIAILIVLV